MDYVYDEQYGMNDTPIGVAEYLSMVNTAIKQMRVTVVGEITGRVNRRGKVTYFSLHDTKEDAVLQCMGFNNVLDKLGIELEEGMQVQVSGYPEIWARTGSFSFKAWQVQLMGEGALTKQFEALKAKLEKEGLFDIKHKKSVPEFITHVGLITSEGREAQADFLTHLVARGMTIELHDARVEGSQAVGQIVNAIKLFNEQKPETQVLVLTRGGGSLENLQAFNDQDVARAIFASRIPIIVGVGHEKDVSIADMVADVRASTPTHAGKIISADWEQADTRLQSFEQQLRTHSRSMIIELQNKLEATKDRMSYVMENAIDTTRSRLKDFEQKLRLGNPELKLKQGYSITTDKNGTVIKSVDQVAKGDSIQVHVNKGKIYGNVEKTI